MGWETIASNHQWLQAPTQTWSSQTCWDWGTLGALDKSPCPTSQRTGAISGRFKDLDHQVQEDTRNQHQAEPRGTHHPPTPRQGCHHPPPQYNWWGDQGEQPGGPSPTHLPPPAQPHTPAPTSAAPFSASNNSSTWGPLKTRVEPTGPSWSYWVWGFA